MIKPLVKRDYSDFGPTLAMEKLIERDGIKISKETLRKWIYTARHEKTSTFLSRDIV